MEFGLPDGLKFTLPAYCERPFCFFVLKMPRTPVFSVCAPFRIVRVSATAKSLVGEMRALLALCQPAKPETAPTGIESS